MMLGLDETAALIERCAPGVARETLLGIIEVESGFRPLAIGARHHLRPARIADLPTAVAEASDLIAAGESVDLGLAQINSRNLARLGLSVAGAFEPCRNLAAAATVLREGYARALAAGEAPQAALTAALSAYNTGHPRRGLANGYVAKVVRAAARYDAAPGAQRAEGPSAPPPPAWDVFASHRPARFVLTLTPGAPR